MKSTIVFTEKYYLFQENAVSVVMKVLDVTVKKYDVFVKIQVSFTPNRSSVSESVPFDCRAV